MLNPQTHSINLSKNEYKVYARHLNLKHIGINGQKRFKQAKILFIGAGGLASSAMIYLAACGIGCIGIIDNDHIVQSNLHRQILYNWQDINKLKVISAHKKIQAINPLCQINTYPYKLNKHNAVEIIQKYDIILDTSDNFYVRYIIDYACYKVHKIHIYGAIQNFEGQISVFNYKSGLRYSDLYPQYLNLQTNSCNNTGVLGILPGTIGLLQATEAIKIIAGAGKILSGYILTYNALTLSFKKIKIRPAIINQNLRYNTVKNMSNIYTISVHNLYKKILHQPDSLLIIDVRQKVEFQIKHIKYAINIPLKQAKNIDEIERIKKNSKNKIIILYCSDNSRSIIASKIYYKYNIPHFRLENGINGWNTKYKI